MPNETLMEESIGRTTSNPFTRLYRGETSFDFVGRKKIWFLISSIVIVAGLISLGVKGLNFGIDFKGGTSWTVIAPSLNPTTVRNEMNKLGLPGATVEKLGGKTVQVQVRISGGTSAHIATEKNDVTSALAKLAGTNSNNVSIDDVGPTWGSYITSKALEALIVFFILISLYITFRFEWKMAVGALIALVHDILVTVGIYSLSGFQVTPDTVVAFLTILGYSLYDTMVVFDRVDDNVKGVGAQGRLTLSGIVNLSMNQVLARSINTSLVAIMPILSVLVIGAEILGATTLQYFGLALFIGLTTGAYSSIFIASPIVAMLKEREPRFKAIRQRLVSRGESSNILSPSQAARISGNVVGEDVQVEDLSKRDAETITRLRREAINKERSQVLLTPSSQAKTDDDPEVMSSISQPGQVGRSQNVNRPNRKRKPANKQRKPQPKRR